MMETEPLPVSCLALLEARSAGGHTEPSLCLQPTVAGGGRQMVAEMGPNPASAGQARA